MRAAHSLCLVGRLAVVAGLAALSAPATAQQVSDVAAGAPFDVSVTVYRDPYRNEGGFDLNNLEGFALITESRRVVLPPGEHRLRFEGVADGIEPASAIVTGLPSGVIEKNRDAALLSPAALVEFAQAQNGRVVFARTNPATGSTTRVEGTIRSAADGGVVFETPQGIEALRCSGLSETFNFEASTTGLSPLPTLSVLTRVTQLVEAVVQLSYLARGFDWSADYVVNMGAGTGKFDLGAWVTLANGNGTGFKDARVQIVAGTLNRETGEVEPIDIGRPIIAQCWPQGSTSDSPEPIYIERAFPLGFDPDRFGRVAMAMPAPTASKSMMDFAQDNVVVTGAKRVEQEELGDLKLYRVQDRTTVASRQSKQVRMLDKAGVPVTRLYEADLYANDDIDYAPMTVLLRTRNDTKNNLGVPLPSGRVSVFETAGRGAAARRLLAAETSLRDIAVNEETELRLSESPDVQIRQVTESREIAGPPRPAPPFLPGANRRSPLDETTRIEVTNARPFAIQAEIRLELDDGQSLVKADRPAAQKNGRPIFRVTIPPNGSLQIRYQTTTR